MRPIVGTGTYLGVNLTLNLSIRVRLRAKLVGKQALNVAGLLGNCSICAEHTFPRLDSLGSR